jgi:hypothetical protein
MVAGKIARLQFLDPVPARSYCQGRVAGQMGFGAKFIELPVVKAAERRRQATEHPDQREPRGDDVDDKAEPHLPGVREAVFGFALHLVQRLAGEEQVRVQIVARVGSIREVSDPVRRFESAAQQITARPHVFHPGHDENREAKISARLEPS